MDVGGVIVTHTSPTSKPLKQTELRPIFAARVPGMAAADSPQTAGYTGEDAIFLDGQNHVMAATGMKSAASPERPAKRKLIGAHHANDQPAGHARKGFPEGSHSVTSFFAAAPRAAPARRAILTIAANPARTAAEAQLPDQSR
jgi:hypothetical protein